MAPRDHVEQPVQLARRAIQHALDVLEVAAAAAFDHVRAHGPRAAGETDQRHPALQFAPDRAHGVHHVTQFAFRIRDRQPVDVGRRADRARDLRAFARLETEADVHRVRHGQDVREQDRRVEAVAVERLQRDLAGELRVHAQLEEAAGLGARRAVLGQVAARLAHHPQRRARRRLAQQGAQQQVVLQRRAHLAAPAKHLRNGLLDRFGGGARIGGIADGTADDDVIGAIGERLRHVHRALLVVDGLVLDRADARRHHQQPVVDEFAQHRRLQAGRNDAVATCLERTTRTRQHELFDVHGETEVVEVTAVEARQHGHREHLDVALGRRRGFHDGLVAVDGGQRDAAIAQLLHRRRDRGRHVEELEVDEDFLATRDHPVEQLVVAARHEQFEPQLVELHGVAELFRQLPGGRRVGDVHGENQAFTVGNRLGHERHGWLGMKVSRE